MRRELSKETLNVEDLLSKLTIKEKASLLSGV
jgi:hypothetical protein